MSKRDVKPLPPLLTDEDAECFTDEADLSDFDLSGFKPVRFEFQPKDARLELRLPVAQPAALKSAAKRKGIPHTRLARQMIDAGLKATES